MRRPLPADARTPEAAEALLDQLRRRMTGRAVTFRRLACNSLLVYVGCKPGERKGCTLWLEPTWHLRSARRVLTGSREAQDAQPRAARAVDRLVGREVESLDVDPVTRDLTVRFGGGLVLRTFQSDPRDDHLWHAHDNRAGLELLCGPRGFTVSAVPRSRRRRRPTRSARPASSRPARAPGPRR